MQSTVGTRYVCIECLKDRAHESQPAIDAFALALMSKYNRQSISSTSPSVQPLVYNTYQAYLRRNEAHLVESLRVAKSNGFALGVKLVRGAYHPHETAAHIAAHSMAQSTKKAKDPHSLSISPDALPPVWSTKDETDACYNKCANILLDAVAEDVQRKERKSWFGRDEGTKTPLVGVLFGTHNWGSCRIILQQLVAKGLARADGDAPDAIVTIGDEITERVALAQLYGKRNITVRVR